MQFSLHSVVIIKKKKDWIKASVEKFQTVLIQFVFPQAKNLAKIALVLPVLLIFC